MGRAIKAWTEGVRFPKIPTDVPGIAVTQSQKRVAKHFKSNSSHQLGEGVCTKVHTETTDSIDVVETTVEDMIGTAGVSTEEPHVVTA